LGETALTQQKEPNEKLAASEQEIVLEACFGMPFAIFLPSLIVKATTPLKTAGADSCIQIRD
jgi:hypothetical protein